jgi:hypothetical protein
MTPERQRKSSTVETTGSRGTPAEEQMKENKGNNRREGKYLKKYRQGQQWE